MFDKIPAPSSNQMGPGLDQNGGPRPVSIKGPRLLKALLLNPGPFYSRGPPRKEGPRKDGRAGTEQNRANHPPGGMKKEWKTRRRGKKERRGHSRIGQNRDQTHPARFCPRSSVVPSFLFLSVSPSSFSPSFLLHRGCASVTVLFCSLL